MKGERERGKGRGRQGEGKREEMGRERAINCIHIHKS